MPTIAILAAAALDVPGVADVFIAESFYQIAIAYMGDHVDELMLHDAVSSRLYAGVRFDPADVIRVGPAIDDLDLTPAVEFDDIDALVVGVGLGFASDANGLHVRADMLMSRGDPRGDVLAAWLDERE